MSRSARAVRKQTKYMKRRDGYKTGDHAFRGVQVLFGARAAKKAHADAAYFRRLGENLTVPVAPDYGTLEYQTWYAENFPAEYAEWLKQNQSS